MLEDVRSHARIYRFDGDKFVEHSTGGGIAVGEDVSVQGLNRFSDQDDRVWLWRDGYLRVDALDIGDASTLDKTQQVKTKPGFFNSDGLTVDQHFATSKDGTKVPYFVQRRTDMKFDGSTPTRRCLRRLRDLHDAPLQRGSRYWVVGERWLQSNRERAGRRRVPSVAPSCFEREAL